jgi:tripartite-type tricarboxylate transporter receptor subunit TctC
LHLVAGAAALPAASRIARAQAYPSRPVRIIVGFPAGLGPDITARLIAQLLSERFGQSFIVDNRPGAGSNIGTEIVVRAPADGYTLLLMTASNAINATVYDSLNFDFIRAVAPVASVGVVPFLMVVNPSFPAQTISEFIAYAKAHPAKINMGSAGYGSAPHMFGELFKMMTGIDLVHIRYRDSYWPDLLAGQTQILFAPVISATGYVQSGQLRALAVTTRTRLEAMPTIPALDEFVPGYEASGWLGVGAPKNTPVEIINKLNNEINAVLADAKAKSRLADVGVVLMPMAPDELGKFIAADTEKWAKVVKFAGIKLQ